MKNNIADRGKSHSSILSPFFNGIKRVLRVWEFLKGDIEEFPLYARIYHSVSIVVGLVMLYNVPFSLAIGMYEAALASFLLLPLITSLFYISRFRNRTVLSQTIYTILINAFFCVNYFVNSGISGSTLLSFCLVHFMTMATMPRSRYLFWTLLNVVLVGGLIYWEYTHTETSLYSYPSRKNFFVDITSTYIVNIVLMFAGLSYIINNYRQERDKAEEQTRKITEMDQQKAKLISIISHDFNTPLNNIKKYLWILTRMDLEDKDRKQFEADLNEAASDTQHLLLNLLNWARTNMDNHDYRPEFVAVRDALEDTIKTYITIAEEKDIQLHILITDEDQIYGDAQMLNIIIRNLINNAIKFTPPGGLVQVAAQQEAHQCRITVTDGGPGIATDKQKQLFSPLTASTGGTSGERGIGLGLSICKEFTEIMGGEIGFVTSENGTVFWVELPVFAEQNQAVLI
ncbi:MAG TPA: HAMP domain-containing sensor histidine kinase [Dyadobacter sp.]|nr:HAMP domain-containing sensor histidine kinase [Dyadobacter sp.]